MAGEADSENCELCVSFSLPNRRVKLGQKLDSGLLSMHCVCCARHFTWLVMLEPNSIKKLENNLALEKLHWAQNFVFLSL